MKCYETIVVGGGPVGSSCAWRLKQRDREALVPDKQRFPRVKFCAGCIRSTGFEIAIALSVRRRHWTLAWWSDSHSHDASFISSQFRIVILPRSVQFRPVLHGRMAFSTSRMSFNWGILLSCSNPCQRLPRESSSTTHRVSDRLEQCNSQPRFALKICWKNDYNENSRGLKMLDPQLVIVIH